jgi:hypothetical protein
MRRPVLRERPAEESPAPAPPEPSGEHRGIDARSYALLSSARQRDPGGARMLPCDARRNSRPVADRARRRKRHHASASGRESDPWPRARRRPRAGGLDAVSGAGARAGVAVPWRGARQGQDPSERAGEPRRFRRDLDLRHARLASERGQPWRRRISRVPGRPAGRRRDRDPRHGRGPLACHDLPLQRRGRRPAGNVSAPSSP